MPKPVPLGNISAAERKQHVAMIPEHERREMLARVEHVAENMKAATQLLRNARDTVDEMARISWGMAPTGDPLDRSLRLAYRHAARAHDIARSSLDGLRTLRNALADTE